MNKYVLLLLLLVFFACQQEQPAGTQPEQTLPHQTQVTTDTKPSVEPLASTIDTLLRKTQSNYSEEGRKMTFSLQKARRQEFEEAKAGTPDLWVYDTLAIKKTGITIKLPLQNTTTPFAIISDTLPEEDETGTSIFGYIGQIKDMGFYLLECRLYEDMVYYLVDKRSGEKTILGDMPKPAPGGLFIANCMLPHEVWRMYGTDAPSGVQVWKLDQYSHTLEKIVEINQRVWVPVDLAWQGEEALFIKVVNANPMPDVILDGDCYYLKLSW